MADEIPAEVASWLAAFAERLGLPAPTDDQIEAVLGLAAVAARGSARQAAPVACWLTAQAGVDVASATDLARGVTS
jgi:hypothetical protein